MNRWVNASTPLVFMCRLPHWRRRGPGPRRDRGSSGGTVASTDDQLRNAELMRHRQSRGPASRSSFAGYRFSPDVIMLAVRWYLRYSLSYRDVEELLGERGIQVDHVTIYRWVQRFTPLLIDAARACRHCPGD